MSSIREAARKWVSGAQACYTKDIAAMSHDLLDKGNNGRAPYDYTYEVATVNRRVARRLRREEPGDWPFESWAVAPAEMRNPEAITADLNSSLEEILSAFDAMTDEQVMGTVPTTEGESPVVDMMHFAAMHTMYHDGQLNQLQAQSGDMEVHWQ